MRENQKILIKLGAILLAIAGIILFIFNPQGIYCKDYYAVVNRADNKSYEAIINENGPIKKTEFKENFQSIYYEDGRTFVFSIYPSGAKEFCRIDITSKEYRFGKKQIGVGTKRKEIESIYKSGKNKYNVGDHDINIVEANTSVRFYFNDQDIVYKMMVGGAD